MARAALLLAACLAAPLAGAPERGAAQAGAPRGAPDAGAGPGTAAILGAVAAATAERETARRTGPGAPRPGLDPEGPAQTCKHFENRARFIARAPAADWIAEAADSCAEALRLLDPATAQDARSAAAHWTEAAQDASRATAAALLDRLTRLRLTVREMNTARVYGCDPRPRALPVAAAGGGWKPQPAGGRLVSRSGEYLIARELGTLTALRGWRALRR